MITPLLTPLAQRQQKPPGCEIFMTKPKMAGLSPDSVAHDEVDPSSNAILQSTPGKTNKKASKLRLKKHLDGHCAANDDSTLSQVNTKTLLQQVATQRNIHDTSLIQKTLASNRFHR